MVGVVEEVDDPTGQIHPGDLTLTLAPGHGAMCEYFLAPLEHVIPLPTGKPLEHLLQAQQLGTVIYASRRLPNIIGKDVAVIGQGSAGLWFDFQLRRMGARRVMAIDLEPYRLAVADAFGATHTVHNASRDALEAVTELTNGQLADLVVEAAGEEGSINLAADLVRKHGHILYFGYPRGQHMRFNFEQFFHKCCFATTVVGAQEEPGQICTRMALDLIAQGSVDLGPMLTHHIPFEQVLRAYELHATRKDGAIKIVIDMDATS
jgi:threonine dehydrogenase-like Zn-dependent dehydrogenase